MIPSAVLPHKVQVQAYLGSGAEGPLYADPVTIRCRLDRTRKMARDAKGQTVTGDAGLIVRPNVAITVESQVTDTDGNVFDVLDVTDGVDLNRTALRSVILAGPR